MKRYLLLASFCLLLLIAATVLGRVLFAQQTPEPADKPGWAQRDTGVATAAQAWHLSGETNDGMYIMAKDIAMQVSRNRGLAIPNDKAFGEQMGKLIIRDTQADPQGLFYNVVDHAVLVTMANSKHKTVSRPAVRRTTTNWTLPDVATSTVSQAWQMSGKSNCEFAKMVKALTAMDLQNRGLMIQNTDGDGQRLGQIMRVDLEAHPDDLLFAVVDRSVRQVAVPATEIPQD